jgi:hypothetical protein
MITELTQARAPTGSGNHSPVCSLRSNGGVPPWQTTDRSAVEYPSTALPTSLPQTEQCRTGRTGEHEYDYEQDSGCGLFGEQAGALTLEVELHLP